MTLEARLAVIEAALAERDLLPVVPGCGRSNERPPEARRHQRGGPEPDGRALHGGGIPPGCLGQTLRPPPEEHDAALEDDTPGATPAAGPRKEITMKTDAKHDALEAEVVATEIEVAYIRRG